MIFYIKQGIDSKNHQHLEKNITAPLFFKVELDDDGYVVSIGKQPLDPERVYKVATIVDFWRKRDAPSIGFLATKITLERSTMPLGGVANGFNGHVR